MTTDGPSPPSDFYGNTITEGQGVAVYWPDFCGFYTYGVVMSAYRYGVVVQTPEGLQEFMPCLLMVQYGHTNPAKILERKSINWKNEGF
jgi:hypothetical protein